MTREPLKRGGRVPEGAPPPPPRTQDRPPAPPPMLERVFPRPLTDPDPHDPFPMRVRRLIRRWRGRPQL